MLRWAGAAAILLFLLGEFALHILPGHIELPQSGSEDAGRFVQTPPLTLKAANSLLANSPSFESAVEAMAFYPHTAVLPKGSHSAVAVLREEKIKL